jgi:hypothetical protein
VKIQFPLRHRSVSIALLAVAAALPSWGASDKGKAMSDAKQAQAALQAITPGGIATSATGYAMKAKLNGKEWIATSMMPQDVTDRIIGNKDGESISLPYDRRNLVAGKTIKFGENRAVDLFTNDDVAIWGGRSGEMTITKVDKTSAEGTFFFTATARDTKKKIEVTEGSFRILLGKK